MKTLNSLFVLLFAFIQLNAQDAIMTNTDVSTTSTGTIDASMRTAAGIIEDGRDITATGTLKIPIVFVKFADDTETNGNWPNADQLPSWAANFVDTEIPTSNIYQNNNFSKFYDLSSGGNGNGTLGEFQVIGDVYFVQLSNNRSYYEYWSRKDQQVSKDVLDILDDPAGDFDVDFTEYDNWEFKVGGVPNTHDDIPDGILDFMLIYWKEESITQNYDVGGVAGLGFSGTITKDGVGIKSSNGVLGFKSRNFGNKNTIWVSAHEIGHHQFGMTGGNPGSHFNGRNDNYGNLQKFSLMVTGDGSHFSAYEKYRLGWLDPIIVTSNNPSVVLNETHKSSINNAIIIPVGYTSSGDLEEYYLLENYHSTNAYSGANPFLTKSLYNHTITKGIIVYHVSEENFDWPTLSQIDFETAEGLFDWEVVEGGSTPSDRLDDLIAKGSPNENSGLDEKDNITATAGTITYTDYLALTPDVADNITKEKKYRYDSNDYFGDQEDLFGLDYNKVFTRWSNPSSRQDDGTHSDVGFEIVSYNSSTHQYTINVAVNYSGIQALAPSKPQYFRLGWSSNHPRLDWTANTEPDLDHYNIYKKVGFGSYALYTTTSNNYYIDYAETKFTGGLKRFVYYKITSEDEDDNESVFTDPKATIVNDGGGSQSKIGSEEEQSLSEVIESYELFSNYPNPFNPSTQITYQIPEDGFVSLIVYNSLGQIVKKLVERNQAMGKYSVTFNAENLPSGVYFYKLHAGEFKKVNKMLLLQ